MTAPAIKATFSDFRLIKGRKVAQLVFEVPIEGADQALETLGGVPRMDKEAWVGIARLDPAKAAIAPLQPDTSLSREKIRKRFNTLPLKQQCAMRCGEPAFQKFLSEEHAAFPISDPETAASFVRGHCLVKSRSEIVEGSPAADKWLALDSAFSVWMAVAA